jgi:hypothetical protein
MIDLRTECIGLSRSNWQRQFIYRLEPNEARKIDLEYEIRSPLLKRIILTFGESDRYFDRDAWERLPEKERNANPPPDVKFLWNKVISEDGKIGDGAAINGVIREYSSFLNDLPEERISQIKLNLPSLIRRSRENESSTRKTVLKLLRIDRECSKDY